MDLSDEKECLDMALKNFGLSERIDILVNCGGFSQRDQFIDCEYSLCDQMMRVNCLSPIALIKGVVTNYLESTDKTKQLQIVNILSVSGLVGVPCRTFYSASKFGLDGFGKAIQGELLDENVWLTHIYPAYVQTNISKNAKLGDGSDLGNLDQNIKKGMKVEEACD
mmetsp:Transcript_2493/g.4192  ORF Transcript_2493/g.4192 Transcript_2493/m.4192 type:complete len:166 (+) Transcript_2493:250-747(+)